MDGVGLPSPKKGPYYKRPDIHITRWDSKYYEDLSTWYTAQDKEAYEEDKRTRLDRLGLTAARPAAGDAAADAAADAATDVAADASATSTDSTTSTDTTAEDGTGELTGPGWVIQLNGYHYH